MCVCACALAAGTHLHSATSPNHCQQTQSFQCCLLLWRYRSLALQTFTINVSSRCRRHRALNRVHSMIQSCKRCFNPRSSFQMRCDRQARLAVVFLQPSSQQLISAFHRRRSVAERTGASAVVCAGDGMGRDASALATLHYISPGYVTFAWTAGW